MIRRASLIAMIAIAAALPGVRAEATFTYETSLNGTVNGTSVDATQQFYLGAVSSGAGQTFGGAGGTQTLAVTFLTQNARPTAGTASGTFVSATIAVKITDTKGNSGTILIGEGGTGIINTAGDFSVSFNVGVTNPTFTVGDTVFTFQRFQEYTPRASGNYNYTLSGRGNTDTTLTAVFLAVGPGAVPEPSSLVLVALGGLGLGAVRLRQRRGGA